MKTLAQDDVASGTGAGSFAGMLNFNTIGEQYVANSLALLSFDQRALGAQFNMR